MKRKKTNNIPIIAIFIIALFGIIASTFAFFTSSAEFQNRFKTKPYSTEVIEEFNSPKGWKPGDITPKIITIKNTGEVDVAARVSYSEKWISSDGSVLSGKQTITDGINQSEINAAIIKFDNENKWIKKDGYYYYYKKIKKSEIAESFISAVEFNKLITSNTQCTLSSDKKSQTCISDGKGYDNATYTLTINVETVQFDLYKEIWNTSIDLGE